MFYINFYFGGKSAKDFLAAGLCICDLNMHRNNTRPRNYRQYILQGKPEQSETRTHLLVEHSAMRLYCENPVPDEMSDGRLNHGAYLFP